MKNKSLLLLTVGFGLMLVAAWLLVPSAFGVPGAHAASITASPAGPSTLDPSLIQDAVTITVGMVPDEAGVLNLKSYNWMSYQGLLRAESELGVV